MNLRSAPALVSVAAVDDVDELIRRARVVLVAAVGRVALTAVAVSVVAGCAYFASEPVKPLNAAPRGATADTGSYPTTLGPPPGRAGSATYGRVLEALRMADYVVVPSLVDPALTRPIPQNTNSVRSSDELPDPLDADDKRNFVVGFSTARGSATEQVLLNIVLRFTTAKAAADVAGDIAAVHARGADAGHPATVSIPRHDDTLAFASETADGAELHSITAHGPYVLLQYVRCKKGLGAATALVSRTLDMQEPLIDQFVPDDPSRFVDLPTDVTGLARRTLPLTPQDPELPARVWTYGPRAALHFQEDSARAATLFPITGVTAVAAGKSTVYEAADPGAAAKLADRLSADRHANGYRPAGAVSGVRAARCFDGGRDDDASPRNFYCAGSAGRYAYEIFSSDQLDAHRQVAAQYRLLTDPG